MPSTGPGSKPLSRSASCAARTLPWLCPLRAIELRDLRLPEELSPLSELPLEPIALLLPLVPVPLLLMPLLPLPLVPDPLLLIPLLPLPLVPDPLPLSPLLLPLLLVPLPDVLRPEDPLPDCELLLLPVSAGPF